MSAAEWVFLALLGGAVPPLVAWDYRVLVREAAAGVPHARLRAYLRGLVGSWAVAALAVALWGRRGGTPAGLGLAPPGDRGDLVVLGLALGMAALMVADLRRILGSAGARADARRQLASVEGLLPHTPAELRTFRALAVTAGVTEEVVYRGWLLAVLTPLVGVWLAVPLAAAAFGVAHAYQGRVGVLRSAGFGLVAGAAFAVTGNLWGLILAHTVVDLMGGELAWRLDGVPEAVPEAYPTGQ